VAARHCSGDQLEVCLVCTSRHRFAREVIEVAVRWYLRYGLSYRDVEELLAERGIEVDHVTV
jgi:transposase-like protein